MTFYYLCLISDGSSLTIHVTKNPLSQLAKQRETTSRYLIMTYNLRFQDKREATALEKRLRERYRASLSPDGRYVIKSSEIIAGLLLTPQQRREMENRAPLEEEKIRREQEEKNKLEAQKRAQAEVRNPKRRQQGEIKPFKVEKLIEYWDKEMPGGTNGVMASFDEIIAAVENRQRKAINAPEPIPQPGIFTEDMKRVVGEQQVSYVATVNSVGLPKLSPKDTTAIWDDDHLIFAEMRLSETIKNLRKNSRLEVNVLDQMQGKGYAFSGTGEIIRNGDLFEHIRTFYHERGVRGQIKYVVLITVDEARPIFGSASGVQLAGN